MCCLKWKLLPLGNRKRPAITLEVGSGDNEIDAPHGAALIRGLASQAPSVSPDAFSRGPGLRRGRREMSTKTCPVLSLGVPETNASEVSVRRPGRVLPDHRSRCPGQAWSAPAGRTKDPGPAEPEGTEGAQPAAPAANSPGARPAPEDRAEGRRAVQAQRGAPPSRQGRRRAQVGVVCWALLGAGWLGRGLRGPGG